MWLVGVVIRRYIDILIIIINFPTPLVLGLFLAAASLLFCSEMAIFNFARRARKLRYYGDVIHSCYRKSAVEHDGGV